MLIHCTLYFFPITVFRALTSLGYSQLEFGIDYFLRTIKSFIYGIKNTAGNYADGDSPIYAIWFLCAICCAILISAILLVVWKNISKTSNRINWWWKNIIRICLAWWMLYYGIIKAIPLQAGPFTPLILFMRVYELPRPFYVFAPLGLSSIYEMFIGWVEIIGGILLLIPRLITFGGLLNFVSMVQIAIYNIFDISLSLNAILLCCYEFILLYPFLQNLNLYLLDQKDLLRKRRIPIIRLNSIKFRRICMGLYTLIIVGYVLQFTKIALEDYQNGHQTNNLLNGIWITESIQTQSQNIPREFASQNWDYLAIMISDSRIIKMNVSNTLAIKLDMKGQIDTNKHRIYLNDIYDQCSCYGFQGAQPLASVSARIDYSIPNITNLMSGKVRKTGFQGNPSEQKAVFVVYLNGDSHPSLIIHTKKISITAKKYLGPEWLR